MYYVQVLWEKKTPEQVARGEMQWRQWRGMTRTRKKRHAIEIAEAHPTRCVVTWAYRGGLPVVYDNAKPAAIDPSLR